MPVQVGRQGGASAPDVGDGEMKHAGFDASRGEPTLHGSGVHWSSVTSGEHQNGLAPAIPGGSPVGFHPNRAPCGHPGNAVQSGQDSIDTPAHPASFPHDTLSDFVQALAECAGDGVTVRMPFGHPTSPAVTVRGQEECLGQPLAGRCRPTCRYPQHAIASHGPCGCD